MKRSVQPDADFKPYKTLEHYKESKGTSRIQSAKVLMTKNLEANKIAKYNCFLKQSGEQRSGHNLAAVASCFAQESNAAAGYQGVSQRRQPR